MAAEPRALCRQSLIAAAAAVMQSSGYRLQGDSSTTDYRVFMQEEGKDVSSWHDIPLRNPDGTLNFVCEIPKDTTAKMEVATVRYSQLVCMEHMLIAVWRPRGCERTAGRASCCTDLSFGRAALHCLPPAAKPASGSCHSCAASCISHAASDRERRATPSSRTSRRASCASTPTTSTGTTACCPRPGRTPPTQTMPSAASR